MSRSDRESLFHHVRRILVEEYYQGWFVCLLVLATFVLGLGIGAAL